MTTISLVECFASIQGEGYNVGRAAVFCRPAGCNLSCVFAAGALCDTPYQRPRFTATLDALFEEYLLPLRVSTRSARRLLNSETCCMLVITGGEPTLQPAFDALVERGEREGFYVAVETNGTRWREGLELADWITVSPKTTVQQGSPAAWHNPHPHAPALDPRVTAWLAQFADDAMGEYRYVIGGPADPVPPWAPAFRHYVSPAVLSDGSGTEWQAGFPGFAPGALDRCLAIVQEDPRWRLSVQVHKLVGQR